MRQIVIAPLYCDTVKLSSSSNHTQLVRPRAARPHGAAHPTGCAPKHHAHHHIATMHHSLALRRSAWCSSYRVSGIALLRSHESHMQIKQVYKKSKEMEQAQKNTACMFENCTPFIFLWRV